MLIDAIMQTDVATVEGDNTVLRATRLMKERGIGAVFVIDEHRRPVGVLTDRDVVVRVIAEGRSLDSPVDEVMSHPVYAVGADSLVFDTLREMARRHVHRMPVIDAEKQLVGIVNAEDALLLLTSELANIAEVMARRPDRPARSK